MGSIKKRRSRRKMGRFPLAYMGSADTDASSQLFWVGRPPTTRDYDGYFIGALWIDESPYPSANPDVYILVSKDNNIALWITLTATRGIETITGDTGGAVGADPTDTIFLNSGIVGLSVDGTPLTYTLELNSSDGGPLFQSLRGDNAIKVYPTNDGYIDILGETNEIDVTEDAGNNKLTLSAGSSIATEYDCDIGSAVPVANVLILDAASQAGGTVSFSGSGNTVSLNTTDANDNISIGFGSVSVLTGSNNLIFGYQAGTSYTNESNNILIGNTGTAADANTIRIGTEGSGSGQQTDSTYIAGIYNGSFGATNGVVIVDNTGKLGSTSFGALPWTPTLSFGGSSTGIVYGIQEGNYQVLGNLVFYSGSITLSSKGTATGIARVEGLPFASSGVFQTQMGIFAVSRISAPVNYTYFWCLNEIGTTNLYTSASGNGQSQILLDDTHWANNSQITVSGFYFRG